MLAGLVIVGLIPIALTYKPFPNDILSNTDIQTYPIQTPELNVSEMTQPSLTISHFEILPLILGLYWIGIVVLIVRQIISYLYLWRIIFKAEKQQIEDCVVCRHDKNNIAPFSWGNFIVLPSNENEPAILLHEKAHTVKKHWIDIVIADFFCIFLWYNPFGWKLKNLIKLNHEYEADAEVINTHIDILIYQKLLILKAIGNRTLHIANNFAISKKNFRRRVLKMNQSQSSKGIKWLSVALLPGIALAAYADAAPWPKKLHDTISNYQFIVQIPPTENTTNSLVEEPFLKEYPATLILMRLPSPLTDPQPLLNQFELSFDLADKDLLPDKLMVTINVDEEGNIVSAKSNYDDNPEVKTAIDRVTNQVCFEIVKNGDKKVETRFVLPIRKEILTLEN